MKLRKFWNNLPKIKKYKDDKYLLNKSKYYIVGRNGHSWDLCDNIFIVFRYWLWHLGINPRIAFFKFKNIWERKF